MSEFKTIAISKIRRSEAAQMRARTNPATIDEYAAAITAGEKFPPVVVFGPDSEGVYDLADGFQRLAACEKASRDKIAVDIREGDLRDAILHACKANEHHGVRRTPDDRRKAVLTLLMDKVWSKKNTAWIAEQCSVRKQFVQEVKRELTGKAPANTGGKETKAAKAKTVPVPGGGTATVNATAQPVAMPAVSTADVVADSYGQTIPVDLRGAFANCITGNMIVSRISDLIPEIKSFCGSPGGVMIHSGSVIEAAKNVVEGLSRNMPAAVCPQCDGTKQVEGKDEKKTSCPSCGGRGWITKNGIAALSKAFTKKLNEAKK